jgi:hypothetical protein
MMGPHLEQQECSFGRTRPLLRVNLFSFIFFSVHTRPQQFRFAADQQDQIRLGQPFIYSHEMCTRIDSITITMIRPTRLNV